MNKTIVSFFGAALMVSTQAHISTALAGDKWDMPMAYPASNFQSMNADEFAKCVATGTNGDINIVTHPNGTLFKGNDIKRAVQTGQAQIGERLLSSHENENAIYGTDSIPFLATSYDASVKLFKAARPELEKVLDSQNLKLLYSVPWPPQGLYFSKDVNKVEDMKGVRVRSYNKATARMAELTGMVPISIEAAEISQALSAGVIGSLITSAVTGQDSKVWENLNHFYEVKAWMPRNTVIVNKDIFAKLSDKNKAAIIDCSTKAEASGLDKSKSANESALAALSKNGMMVLPPSPALAASMAKIGETMTAEWVVKAGDAGKKVIDDFKK